MKKHTSIYFKHFGYGEQDFVPCEVAWFENKQSQFFEIQERAKDVHHIEGRGKGKDVIENLMAVTRENHERCEGKVKPTISKEQQKLIHKAFMEEH